jgi:hypothetical protein
MAALEGAPGVTTVCGEALAVKNSIILLNIRISSPVKGEVEFLPGGGVHSIVEALDPGTLLVVVRGVDHAFDCIMQACILFDEEVLAEGGLNADVVLPILLRPAVPLPVALPRPLELSG